MEATFDFSTSVISLIIREIESAQEYVRIAIFQLHNQSVLEALDKKLKDGVRVEIITLPYDSINKDIRPKIKPLLRQTERNGAKIYFDKWNVGDPSRTTTAVGRWYSFHGKFIVTDKSAIALSANLTQSQELDAILIFKNAEETIGKFNAKFEQILDFFVSKDDASDGTIRRRIIDVGVPDSQGIFRLPENVDSKHSGHWIRQYPIELCGSVQTIKEGLCITPFDCRGRDLLTNAIDEADEFAYISTESFTDLDFSDFLVRTASKKGIDIRVLTGARSMDFTDRIESMFRDLLAQGIDVRTSDEDLHAKLLVTDKVLIISSINLNKINLGFHPTLKYWRENTESVFICTSPELVKSAKEKYLGILNHSSGVGVKLTEKLEGMVRDTLFKGFGLESSSEARKLFAKFILKRQMDVRRTVMKVGKITEKLMAHYHRTKVEKQDFVSAIVLYYLSERKQDFPELQRSIEEVDGTVKLAAIISSLEFARFVEKEGDYFKINVETLFS